MDNYGILIAAREKAAREAKEREANEEVELVDRLYHGGFCNDDIVEVFVQDLEYDQDDAEIRVSEIMQSSS